MITGSARAHALHRVLAWCLVAVTTAVCIGQLGACVDVGGASSSTAPIDTSGAGTAFRLAGPNGAAIVVPAYLNGHGPYDLILDTGATLTCVDSALATQLSLPRERAMIGASVGVAGGGRVQIVRVDSLRVGEAAARGLNACTMNLSNLRILGTSVRGLLGLNFLRNFRVTLDFRGERLHLTQPPGRTR